MAGDFHDAGDVLEAGDELVEVFGGVDEDGDAAVKDAFGGVDGDAAEFGLGVFADGFRDFGDDGGLVFAHEGEDGLVGGGAFVGPLGIDNAVGVAVHEFDGVFALAAVHLDAFADGDEADDVVAVDGVAAAGEFVVHVIDVAVDEEDVFAGLAGVFDFDVFAGEDGGGFVVGAGEDVFDFSGGVLADGDAVVEVEGEFIFVVLHEFADDVVRELYFPVFEAAHEGLLADVRLVVEFLVEELADAVAGFGGDGEGEPVGFGGLVGGGDDGYLVAVFEEVAEGFVFVVHDAADTFVADVGVDGVGEVEEGGACLEGDEVAFGGEDVDLLVLEVDFHVVEEVDGVVFAAFEDFAEFVEPVLDDGVGGAAFVFPVGGESFFGNLVHAFGAYLDLDPAVAGTEDGGLEGFVAVGFGDGYPVAEALGVGGVAVGHDGVDAPAVGFFVVAGAVDDEAEGEDVVYLFEFHLAFAHLVEDGGDGFRAVFHFVADAPAVEFGGDGGGEFGDVGFAGAFGFAELMLDFGVKAGVGVAQGAVFHLRFDVVEPEAVGEGDVYVVGLLGELFLFGFGEGVRLAQGVEFFGEEDELHADVLGEAEEELAEVVGIDDALGGVNAADVQEPFDDLPHFGAEAFLHFGEGEVAFLDGLVDEGADDGGASQADFAGEDEGDVEDAEELAGVDAGGELFVFEGDVEGAADEAGVLAGDEIAAGTEYGGVFADDFQADFPGGLDVGGHK